MISGDVGKNCEEFILNVNRHFRIWSMALVWAVSTSISVSCSRTCTHSEERRTVPKGGQRSVILRTGEDYLDITCETNGTAVVQVLISAERLSIHCSAGAQGNDLNIFITTNGLAVIRNYLDDKTVRSIFDSNGDMLPDTEIVTDRASKKTSRLGYMCVSTNIVSPQSTRHTLDPLPE